MNPAGHKVVKRVDSQHMAVHMLGGQLFDARHRALARRGDDNGPASLFSLGGDDPGNLLHHRLPVLGTRQDNAGTAAGIVAVGLIRRGIGHQTRCRSQQGGQLTAAQG